MHNNAPNILFVGYEDTPLEAPHQAMAAWWLEQNGAKVTRISLPPSTPATLGRLSRLGREVAFLRDALAKCRHLDPDLIYVQGGQNTPVGLALAIVSPAKICVYHTQDVLDFRRGVFQITEKLFARRAALVISNEESRARYLATILRLKDNPKVIPTYLPRSGGPTQKSDEDEWWLAQLREAKLSGATLIASGGPFSERRMSHVALEAIARGSANLKLVFNGCSADDIRNQVKADWLDAALRERCLFLPRLTYDRLLSVYDECHAGLLLYPNDSLGNFHQCPGRFTEYLRAGLQPIMSDFPHFREIHYRFGLGSITDPYDAASVLGAIEVAVAKALDGGQQQAKGLADQEFYYEKYADAVLRNLLKAACRRSGTAEGP